jgi:uncharacterized coiled-coil DUF342 family protein
MTTEELRAKFAELDAEHDDLNPQWDEWLQKRNEAQAQLDRITNRKMEIRAEQLRLADAYQKGEA